jgi:hypothetical protein
MEGFVRTLADLQDTHQVQEESLDEPGTGAHQAVELRASGQGREGIEQVAVGVAVEVPLAGETGPPGEKMARVTISLSEREAWGPERFIGGYGSGKSRRP